MSPAFDRLILFLDWSEQSFMEDSLTVLSKCCKTKQHQELLLEAGVLPRMMKLMFSQKGPNQSMAIGGLAKLSDGNESVCSYLAKKDEVVKILMRFCRTQVVQVQLDAASVLVNIITSSSTVLKSTSFDEELAYILVSLLEDSEKVPGLIADLISGRRSIQQPFRGDSIIQRLLKMANESVRSVTDLTAKTGAIRALGVVYWFHQESRKRIIGASGVFQILKDLESELPEVRLAILECLESIVIHAQEQDTPNVDPYSRTPPIAYSSDLEIRLKELGSVALWFCYLDYPDLLKQPQNQTFQFLLRYAKHPERAVQFKAIWAISNFITVNEEITDSVMSELRWSVLSEMTQDPSNLVQQVGLRWLRGLCERDNLISSVICWSNGELLSLVSSKLDVHE